MKNQPFWIKMRDNPQTGTYYVAMGQMSKTAAKCYEKPIYGSNYMLRFDTQEAYENELAQLKAKGEHVQ